VTFDISQYELEDTATMTVKNARGDDDLIGEDGVNPVTIEVYSPGSPQGVKALHKSGRAAQMRVFKSMRGDFDSKDAENADREQVEKLCGFTKAINNWPLSPALTFGNPRLVYFNRQLEEFIGKLGNFSKAPSPV
jgi:hypothetical protein